MNPNRIQPSSGFGSRITPLGKWLLMIYGSVYVLELICHHWLDIPVAFSLWLVSLSHPDFHLWQVISHPFIHDPRSPFSFLINCLVFYFFASQVESHFGSRRFLTFFYIAALGGMFFGLLFGGVSGFNGPFYGMLPSLLASIVVFGLLNPEATILLMFILPVQAKYLSYGTIIITLLTFLAKANVQGAYHLGGILFGWLYFKGYIDPRKIKLQYLNWKLKRLRSQFSVVNGHKDQKENDRPTIH